VRVDSITPTVLIYDRPATGLEAKFSLPFCAAAALVDGRVDIDSFGPDRVHSAAIGAVMPRVVMQADPSLDGLAPPLTQARISVRLRDGRVLSRSADGARGYPERPATDAELDRKFVGCAAPTLGPARALAALDRLRSIEQAADVRDLLAGLTV